MTQHRHATEHRLRTFLAVGLLLASISPWAARAADIIQDQFSEITFLAGPPGQSFTAEAVALHSISVYFLDTGGNLSPIAGVRIDLFEGDGYAGELLATRELELTTGYMGWAELGFSGVSLTVGKVYSFSVSSIDGNARGVIAQLSSETDAYPGGHRLNASGPTGQHLDLAFRIRDTIWACSVTNNQNGSATISCEDGTTYVVKDGQDGASCTVADDGDGSATISCDDGSSYVVRDGVACTVADNGDGSATISCDDGSSYTVSDGEDGLSCTVIDNEDGTATISCEDGSSYVVSNGADGADGEDGAAGTNGSSCSVTQNDDGTATISCEDGTSAVIGAPRGCSTTGGGALAWAGAAVLLGLARRARTRTV